MKVLVKNVLKTTQLKPSYPYHTWIEYWEDNGGETLEQGVNYECPACGRAFKREEFDGCHVQKILDAFKRIYIIPLCSGCNHRSEQFGVDESLLIPVS